MTDNKIFKNLVRAFADYSGVNYNRAREKLIESGLAKPDKQKPRALVVGERIVADAMKRIFPEMEFAPSIDNVKKLHRWINNKDIDNQIDALFIMDTLFSPRKDDEDFMEPVRYMTEHFFVGIINYMPRYNDTIIQHSRTGYLQFKISPHFIDPQRPRESFYAEVGNFYKELSMLDGNYPQYLHSEVEELSTIAKKLRDIPEPNRLPNVRAEE